MIHHLSRERSVAIAAVRRACFLTASVSRLTAGTVVKQDASPVTTADYSAQALINTIIGAAFPDDPIVGEEDAAELREEGSAALRSKVCELANAALLETNVSENEAHDIGLGERTEEELLAAIDRGNFAGGKSGRESCDHRIAATIVLADQLSV